jgi:hypothetical protein
MIGNAIEPGYGLEASSLTASPAKQPDGVVAAAAITAA